MDNLEFIRVLDDNLTKIVESLADEIWRNHYIPMIGKSQVDYMLNNLQSQKAVKEQITKGVEYFLLKMNDNYVGYFALEYKDKKLFLSKIYLKQQERGKGYARKILDFIQVLALEKGINKISLTVNKNNTDSIDIYKKLGFYIADSVVEPIGKDFIKDDYKMEKTFRKCDNG